MDWRKYQDQQRVAELGDRFMSYVDRGEGQPLVLLHGAPTWGYVWHAVLPELEKRRRVVVPDLLGYGWSDRSDRFARGAAAQAEAVSSLLQHLGLDHVDVAGHDVGAAVAMRLAAFEPRRVGRLALLSAACYDAMAPVPDRRLQEGFSKPEPATLAGLLAPYRTEAGRLSLARNVAALDPNHTMELVPHLPRLDAPALILWGDEDPFRPVDYARRLAADLPKAQLSVLKQARHFLPLERPDTTASLLLNFLN